MVSWPLNRHVQKISQNVPSDKYLLIGTFVLSLLPRIFFLMLALPVRTTSDELATMAAGAYAAGYDWSNVISNAGYYGWGFTILLAPLFRFINNPVILYRSMLFVISILQSLIAPISFCLMSKFFPSINGWLRGLVALACAYCVATRAMIVYNESAIILLFWTVVLLLCILFEKRGAGQKACIPSFLLALCLAYLLSIHVRTLVVWGAVFVCFLCVAIVYRYSIVHLPTFLCTTAVASVGVVILMRHLQNVVWLVGQQGAVRNTLESSASSFNLSRLLNPNTWPAVTATVVGQIITIILFSLGVFAFAIPIGVKMAKDNLIKSKETTKPYSGPMFILALVCGTAIFATIGMQAVMWLSNTFKIYVDGLASSGNRYGLKAFTYIRYFAPYCGPLLIMVFSFFVNLDRNTTLAPRKKLFKQTIFFFSLFLSFFTLLVFPYFSISRTTVFIEAYMPFTLRNRYEPLGPIGYTMLYAAIIGSFLLAAYLLYKKHYSVLAILLCLAFAYQYSFNAINFDLINQKINYEHIRGQVDFVNTEGTRDILPDDIYYYETRPASSHNRYYLSQFVFKEKRIHPATYISDDKTAILSYETYVFGALFNGYTRYKLGEKEYLYVNDSDIISNLAEIGILPTETIEFTGSSYPSLRITDTNPDPQAARSYKEDSIIHLMPGGIQYGPYSSIPEGFYEVEITGAGLEQARFSVTAFSGEKRVLFSNLVKTDNSVTFTLNMQRGYGEMEFVTQNVGGGIVDIYSVNLTPVS